MKKPLTKFTVYQLGKVFCIGVLALYTVVASVLLIKFDPKSKTFLVTNRGTYEVKEVVGEYEETERQNFVEGFIKNLYEFDQNTYSTQISSKLAKKMNSELWDKKKTEFESISERMKSDPISERYVLTDLRKVDESHYEADLTLKITERLKTSSINARLSITLASKARTESNPYPYEVKSYDDQKL